MGVPDDGSSVPAWSATLCAVHQSGDALTAAVKVPGCDNSGAALSELIIVKSHRLASMVGYPPRGESSVVVFMAEAKCGRVTLGKAVAGSVNFGTQLEVQVTGATKP